MYFCKKKAYLFFFFMVSMTVNKKINNKVAVIFLYGDFQYYYTISILFYIDF